MERTSMIVHFLITSLAFFYANVKCENALTSSSENLWHADDPEDLENGAELGAEGIIEKQTLQERNTRYQEGDMRVTTLQEMVENGFIGLDVALEDLAKWPSNIIPYVFAKGFNGKRAIRKAFKHFAQKSCIKFRPKRAEDKDYIYFYNGRGCWSYVGNMGGKQHLSLPHYCRLNLGIPVHEILHSLGFYHQQSRPDRDKYIEVMFLYNPATSLK